MSNCNDYIIGYMCQLVIVIVMITIYAISNSVVMITIAHVITTTLVCTNTYIMMCLCMIVHIMYVRIYECMTCVCDVYL